MKNTLEWRDPEKLKNHLLNISLYGDKPDPEFVEQVKKHGITAPIIVLPDDTIVSGHRRRQAACLNEIKKVPVYVRRDLTDPLDIEELLIVENEQRVKTTEQRAREFARLKEIEKERAAKRQQETRFDGERQPGSTVVVSVPPPSKPEENRKSREIAAAKVGMSPRSAERAAKVAQAIDEAEAAGDTERATDLRESLNRSVSEAHRKAVDEPDKKRDPEAVRHLKASQKAQASLQEHILNASRCDPNGGADYKACEGYFLGIHHHVEAALRRLK